MVVQHNITAMNSNRMLNVTTKTQAKSTEKLSSGYKINRAADDAAGLSISEKMRKQIRGLTQASSNAQDGISAVQTAEGALSEVQDMLQRMNELAVKSANGTNSSDDRDYIQSEVDQLVSEIDRVAATTKFNETYLLSGDSSKTKVSGYKTVTASTGELTAPTAGETGTYVYYNTKWYNVDTGAEVASADVSAKIGALASAAQGDRITVTGSTAATVTHATKLTLYNKAGKEVSGSDLADYVSTTKILDSTNNGLYLDKKKTVAYTFAAGDFTTGTGDLTLTLHVGADSTTNNQISVDIATMSSTGIGVNGIQVDGTDDTNALAAIDTISSAIQNISKQRSALGAVQNRLEHTINNLDNVVENTTSAESAIRDTDMATEMVSYSNNNILAQAGQAMLAQANQSNQGVLSLLS